MERKAPFTLLELLIVVAIIGILASLILPGLGSARQAAYKADCVSNLKQISNAYVMYQDDWEAYPSDGYVLDDFRPVYGYLNSLDVFSCKGNDDFQVNSYEDLNGNTPYLRNGSYEVIEENASTNSPFSFSDIFEKFNTFMTAAVADNPYNIADADAEAIANAQLGEGIYDRSIDSHRSINFVAMDGTYNSYDSNLGLWQVSSGDDNSSDSDSSDSDSSDNDASNNDRRNAMAGRGNNAGGGNNADGNDSDNPAHGDGSADDDEGVKGKKN